MFEKMIGVSPPQTGKAQDSKVANQKDFRDTAESKGNYKSDFERALKEKESRQKRDLGKDKPVAKKEELRADKKEKKSSGGIKKKMTNVDDKMVSSGMASVENEVETPDPKKEDPAMIEVENKIKENSTSTDKMAAVFDKAALAQHTMQEDAPAVAEEKPAEMSLDAELGAAVGYKPSEESNKSNKDLLNKIKGFDSSPNVNAKQTSAFEKDVLSQLQKDNGFGSGQSSQFDQKDQGGDLQQDAKSNLKQELLGQQLHAGASSAHSGFKAHLEATSAPASIGADAQLEAHRDANVNEIMQQAQYLVKKGGGEVSVRMSPEGMGEVHLKVLLQDGKLNVELQTQDKNVKKLIEESLSDLKSGLAAHRLSLEHVKIDTVNATNADNNTQMQSNLNQGGSEGRARDFWSETQRQMDHGSNRENSQGRSFNNDNVSSQVNAVKSTPAQALRTYGGTKGATINRVA